MTTYLDRPWVKNYDPGVPKSLEPYPDHGMHELLRKTAKETPDNIALLTPAKLPIVGWQDKAITFQQLDQWSDALAAALVEMGLTKGDRVAIVMPNCVAFVLAYYATLKAGGVVAATNPTYPPGKLQYQINDCDAKIIFTLTLFYNTVKHIQPQTKATHVIVANIKEYLPGLGKLLFTIAREKKDGHRIDDLQTNDHWLQDVLTKYAGRKVNVDVKGDDLALFQYTGGTTGVSKGAMLTHKNLIANMLQIMSWTSEDTGAFGDLTRSDLLYLAVLPLFHVFGLVVLLSQAVASGSKVVLIANPRETDTVVGAIAHYQPNVFLGVPAMYNAIVNHPDVKSGAVTLDCIHIASSGAAPLPPATRRDYLKSGGKRLNEGYGMSETSAASHSNPLVGEQRDNSVGLPFPDMDIRIVSLDDGETDVPIGDVGEIVMAGPNIMQGYHGMPTETSNALREKGGKIWLYSGDIGRMDEDGYFYIVDRKKDMALIGGFNVYPTAIEKVLKDHPAVLEVAVAAIPHPEKEGQESLKAWVVLQTGQSATEDDFIKHCENFLAPYEVPRRIAFVAEIPKTAIGKTLRRELVQMEMDAQEKVVTQS